VGKDPSSFEAGKPVEIIGVVMLDIMGMPAPHYHLRTSDGREEYKTVINLWGEGIGDLYVLVSEEQVERRSERPARVV